MEKKYISFSPYFSGLSNVIMSYEIAFAISYITGRTLILPPKTWLLFISEGQNLENFSDIWQVFDKDLVMSEFNCVDQKDVPEFKEHLIQIRGEKSFTENIGLYFTSENRGEAINANKEAITQGNDIVERLSKDPIDVTN